MVRMHFPGAAPTAADEAEAHAYEVEQYRKVLSRMDWRFEFSDDARFVREARDMLDWLRQHQPVADPDMSIWRSIAPEGFGIPQP